MKNILKKNQVIITALALMLAIAGYLQMAGNTKSDSPVSSSQDGQGEYEITSGDIASYYQDISDEDMDNESLAASENEAARLLLLGSDQTGEDVAVSGSDAVQEGNVGGEDVGAAILVSTTIRGDYSLNAKLHREQTRAKNKALLMEMLADESISEAQKQTTIDTLLTMTAIAEKELACELLLEAKGFPDAVVNIVEDEVDVVINCESVTDRQIAQIEDIVTRKTGVAVENMYIMPAIQEE